MALDTSVILPQQPQPNALAMAGNVAQTVNALQSAQLGGINLQNARAQLLARQAMSNAYQQATDPQTGVTDLAKVQSIIAGDPNGAWMAPQITQAIQEQQKRQYDLQQQALAQTAARTGVFSSALGPLLRLGPNVQPADVYGAINRVHAAGFPTDEIIREVGASMPMPTPGQAADPAYGQKLHDWALNIFGASQSPADAAKFFTPAPTRVDTGGRVLTYDANPITNPNATQFQAQNTMTPQQAGAPVPGPPNAKGAPTNMTAAAYAQRQGLGYLVDGGGAQPPSTAPAFGATTGRFPAALAGPGGAGPAAQGSGVSPAYAQPPQAPATPGPMATGLPPGVADGMNAAAKASADQWAALQNQVGGTAAGGAGSAGRIYMLQHAQSLLQSLGTTGTGPSSPQTQAIGSYLQSLPLIGPIANAVGVNPQSLANYDEANKALTAYASARAGAHGPGTDAQLATTLSSNASTHISNLAAQDVVRANIGLERMDQAQAQAFQAAKDPTSGQPLTPDQFSNFSANWNQQMDPRAFVADQLPRDQFAQLVNGMAPTDQAKFRNTFNAAVLNGWISPPAWMQQPTAAVASTPPTPAAPPVPPTASPAPMTGGPGNGN